MSSLSFNHTEILKKDLFRNKELLGNFEQTALEVFYYQYTNNTTYRKYCDLLGRRKPQSIEEIPFLPIETFKTHKLICGESESQLLFKSSGTTGMTRSQHFIKEAVIYQESFLQGFRHFYGEPESFCFLALLPNYLQQGDSSLVYMVEKLIQESGNPQSGFFLDNHDELQKRLLQLEDKGQKTILIGVSFALLDFVESRSFQLKNTTVMETGGMKGKRKELPRAELHTILKEGFGVDEIHSEYGMTELLSQAYSFGKGIFSYPPWMRILIRETNDPFSYTPTNTSGGINIIDLANIHSCSFIQTQDLGRQNKKGEFEVLGRFDSSDIRGCNLMITDR